VHAFVVLKLICKASHSKEIYKILQQYIKSECFESFFAFSYAPPPVR